MEEEAAATTRGGVILLCGSHGAPIEPPQGRLEMAPKMPLCARSGVHVYGFQCALRACAFGLSNAFACKRVPRELRSTTQRGTNTHHTHTRALHFRTSPANNEATKQKSTNTHTTFICTFAFRSFRFASVSSFHFGYGVLPALLFFFSAIHCRARLPGLIRSSA